MENNNLNLEGRIANSGIVIGKIHISQDGLKPQINDKYILVCKYSSPEMAPAMFGAIGVITQIGGIMSHLAVVSREINIPCITGVKNIFDIVKDGNYVKLEILEDQAKLYLI